MKKIYFIILSLVILLSACSSNGPSFSKKTYVYGIQATNTTNIPVQELKIISSNHKVFSCGNITPHTSCSTKFPPLIYKPGTIKISWSQNGQLYQHDLVLPKLKNRENNQLMSIVKIQKGGQFQVSAR